ncbi:MAG TPA: cyclodeaminase/cyclohydrolase family protein [Phycisphaerae bacterium]|nr:cyclodeaminase/cyclohydrolase family protein [Phycisphaerae bacterium]
MSEQPRYLDLPLRRFLEDTAAAQPTPGGGSVAALTAALASATGRMAANYTVGRKRFADVQQEVSALQQRLATAGQMLEQLVAEDMIAYRQLQAVWRRDDATPASQVDRSAALVGAIAVPFEVVAVAGALLADLDRLKDVANPDLLSDVGVAAELAVAAARSAALNVRINLNQLDNAAEADSLRTQLSHQLEHVEDRYRSVSTHVNQWI